MPSTIEGCTIMSSGGGGGATGGGSSSLQTPSEKPVHYRYLKEFRVEQCPLFPHHKCALHRPFICFNWHFPNQRRRRPIRKRDGTFNYSADTYCTNYDETTGTCPDGDDCPYLHRTAGDTERRYHLRYFKTCMCVYETDSRGYCTKNGSHCAFAHGDLDKRPPVFDIKEISSSTINQGQDEDINGINQLDKERMMVDDPKWQDANYVLLNYKTEQCKRPPRICRQGYACPQYHNYRDRRRSPQINKYRSTPCPNVKHGDEWYEPNICDELDSCSYCHTRTEQQFHPEIYKSTKCHDIISTNYCPRGPFCAFAHTDHEMNINRNINDKIFIDILNSLPSQQLQLQQQQQLQVQHSLESNNNQQLINNIIFPLHSQQQQLQQQQLHQQQENSTILLIKDGDILINEIIEEDNEHDFMSQSYSSVVATTSSNICSSSSSNGGDGIIGSSSGGGGKNNIMSSSSSSSSNNTTTTTSSNTNNNNNIINNINNINNNNNNNILLMGSSLMDSLMIQEETTADVYNLFPPMENSLEQQDDIISEFDTTTSSTSPTNYFDKYNNHHHSSLHHRQQLQLQQQQQQQDRIIEQPYQQQQQQQQSNGIIQQQQQQYDHLSSINGTLISVMMGGRQDLTYLSLQMLKQCSTALKIQLDIINKAITSHSMDSPHYPCLNCKQKDKYRAVVLVPCDHQVVCIQCAPNIIYCPLCQVQIRNRKSTIIE